MELADWEALGGCSGTVGARDMGGGWREERGGRLRVHAESLFGAGTGGFMGGLMGRGEGEGEVGISPRVTLGAPSIGNRAWAVMHWA